MKPTNYTPYHIHTMLSNGVTNIDSITDFHDYVDKAKEYGMKAFGFAEHGSLFAWLKKKEYIESCGMKYIHAVEAYLTEDYESKPHLYSAVNLVDTAMSGKTVRVKFYNYYKRENEGDWAATINEEGNRNNGKDTLIDIETLKDEGYKKTMDNYHIILIARNYDGVKELNKLVSQSFNRNDYHFYRYPRITFEELFNTSNNIIVTTACLGGVLHSGTPTAKEKMLSFLKKNKERCFLEIQHHIVPDQIGYNQLLYKLSQDLGVRLIAGTDSHSLNAEHTDGRAIMQAAKDVFFADEGDWDLEFKSLDELISVYKFQASLPMEVIYEAINNTNVMADMVEEFKVDYSPKYPQLYADSEQVFRDKINEGIKKRHIMDKPNYQEYLDRIEYEFKVYKHNGAINFMLLEEDYKAAMRKKNIKYGYSRGSVSGSIIAYLLYITEIDSVKYNLNFERFMNTERVSLADVDTDWLSEDRDEVRKYLYNKAGLYCCDIVTFNTVALKGAIRDVCRGFYNINIRGLIIPAALKSRINKWKESIKGHDARSMDVKMPKDISDQLNDLYNKNATYKEVPYDYLKFAEELIALAEEDIDKAKKKYPKIFKYVDMVDGVVVSVGNHPAGCVVSPFPVDEWFGTFTTSSDPYPVSLLNMKEIDSLNFVKLDILGLDNIGLIYKTCEAAGIPFATPDNIPPDDQAVWDSIRDDTTMIFQWESNSATAYLRQLFSEETIAKIREKNPNASYMDLLSIGNGAIRPAGESYRDKLAQGIYQDNGHKALNKFMDSTLGYCIEENQLIQTIDGQKPIKDIVKGDIVYTQSGTSKVTKQTFMGLKPTITVKTECGDIICTKDHKILSEFGWINACDLSIGDTIAYRVGCESEKDYPKFKLKLIGYLLGDGILTSLNNVGFVNRNIDVINDFANCASQFDNCTTSINNRRSRVNKLDLYYVNVKHIIPHKRPTECAKYLMSLGMKYPGGGGVCATEKHIPKFIFGLNKECLKTIIGAYTDTDCSVKNNNRKSVKYKTSSYQLADDLMYLIRLLGYSSKKYYDPKTDSYTIMVLNAGNYLIELFDYSYKIRACWNKEELLIHRRNYDSVVWQSLVNNILQEKNICLKDVCRKTNGINLYSPKKYTTTSTLRIIEKEFPETFPQYLIDDNLKYIKVIGIEDNGNKRVYDLSIENEHNFLCNGFVVHNCIYQEQVIEFLHSFCGYTMGEADIVRRGFAKKTGTEKFIPKIKEGFTKTMQEKYGVDSAESDKLIVNFIKVIEDASSYLFSKNHADPYSWIGYICGYLRYYYPLEFITTALNIFEDKEEKSLAIIDYAQKRGIPISPIKFRHSIAKYSFNKETNTIFKGISSIKFMNETVANEMYELRNNEYSDFIELINDLETKTSIDARQMNILIDLDFFEEFGDANKLKEQYKIYQTFFGRKQINKRDIESMGLTLDMVRPYSNNETEKMFRELNSLGLTKILAQNVQYTPRKLGDVISAQITHLGYITIMDDRYRGMAAVLSVDTKYSPKLKMYSLKNGTTLDCKINKRTFNKMPLNNGDIVRIMGTKKKPKSRKNADGKWEDVPGTSELWITKYIKTQNL